MPDVETLKVCTKCHAEKPLSAFPICIRYSGGRKTWCRTCQNRANYESKKRNPEALRALDKRKKDRYRKNHPAADRVRQLRYHYGMTVADFDQMLHAQGGRCKICKRPPNEGKRLSIDHCHQTGKVRGLLCKKCNTAIGLLNDDLGLVIAAANYLGAPYAG